MNLFQSVFYGILSGITEFLPLSSFAHQQMFLQLCGESTRDPARDFLVHVALLLALFISCRPMLENMRRESRGGGRRMANSSGVFYDQKVLNVATIPMVTLFFVVSYIFRSKTSLLLISIFLILNGILLFVPDRIITGNKNANAMSALDSLLVGIAGALSAIPGVSRLGCSVSISMIRGVDRQNALRLSLLLSISALWAWIALDLVSLFSGAGISQWQYIFHYILSALGAFFSAYGAIRLIRFWAVNQNFTIFSYFSWGASLICFFLYLTVV